MSRAYPGNFEQIEKNIPEKGINHQTHLEYVPGSFPGRHSMACYPIEHFYK